MSLSKSKCLYSKKLFTFFKRALSLPNGNIVKMIRNFSLLQFYNLEISVCPVPLNLYFLCDPVPRKEPQVTVFIFYCKLFPLISNLIALNGQSNKTLFLRHTDAALTRVVRQVRLEPTKVQYSKEQTY